MSVTFSKSTISKNNVSDAPILGRCRIWIVEFFARHINDLKALVSAVDLDLMGVSWEEGEKD